MKERKEKKKKRKSSAREREEENGDETKTESATRRLEIKSTTNLNDIDAEIERVLSRLNEENEKENDSSSGESSSSGSSSSSLGRIAPLPPEAYPEHYGYGSKRGNEFAFKGKRLSASGGVSAKASVPSSNALIPGLAEREKNRPKCELCHLSFTSRAQLEEHLQGKGHRKKAAGGIGGGGARSQGPNRQQQIRREVKPPEGPHCKVCKKMFTSLAQKEEHEGGKWHKMRVEGKLAPSNKPYVM